jgi:hypothetical protein
MVAQVAQDSGVTALRYQRVDAMIASMGLPREKLGL